MIVEKSPNNKTILGRTTAETECDAARQQITAAASVICATLWTWRGGGQAAVANCRVKNGVDGTRKIDPLCY